MDYDRDKELIHLDKKTGDTYIHDGAHDWYWAGARSQVVCQSFWRHLSCVEFLALKVPYTITPFHTLTCRVYFLVGRVRCPASFSDAIRRIGTAIACEKRMFTEQAFLVLEAIAI